MRAIAGILLLSLSSLLFFGGCAKKAPEAREPQAAAVPVAATSEPAPPAPPMPTCDDAASHALEVVMNSDEMKNAIPEQRKEALTRMKDLHAEIVKECVEKAWDARTLACLMETQRLEDLERCDSSSADGPQARRADERSAMLAKNPAVAATEDWADAVCVCKDADCAMKANLDGTEKLKKFRDAKGTKAEAEAIVKAIKKAQDCMEEKMKAGNTGK